MKLQPADFLNAVFLDIETTGISPAHSELTCIALYRQHDAKEAILYLNDLHGATETLRPLQDQAEQYGYDLLQIYPLPLFAEQAAQITRVVTYNGTRFDLPFIAYHLPQVGQAMHTWQHLDLYTQIALPLRDLGKLNSPNLQLKTLLARLQIPRHPEVARMRGEDAVRLWNHWKYLYDSQALTALSLYALEDARCTRMLLQRLLAIQEGDAWLYDP